MYTYSLVRLEIINNYSATVKVICEFPMCTNDLLKDCWVELQNRWWCFGLFVTTAFYCSPRLLRLIFIWLFDVFVLFFHFCVDHHYYSIFSISHRAPELYPLFPIIHQFECILLERLCETHWHQENPRETTGDTDRSWSQSDKLFVYFGWNRHKDDTKDTHLIKSSTQTSKVVYSIHVLLTIWHHNPWKNI